DTEKQHDPQHHADLGRNGKFAPEGFERSRHEIHPPLLARGRLNRPRTAPARRSIALPTKKEAPAWCVVNPAGSFSVSGRRCPMTKSSLDIPAPDSVRAAPV